MLKLAALEEAMNSSDVKLLAVYDTGIEAWSYPIVTRFSDFSAFLMGTRSYYKQNLSVEDGVLPLYLKFPESFDLFVCGKFNIADELPTRAFNCDFPVNLGNLKEIIDYLEAKDNGEN